MQLQATRTPAPSLGGPTQLELKAVSTAGLSAIARIVPSGFALGGKDDSLKVYTGQGPHLTGSGKMPKPVLNEVKDLGLVGVLGLEGSIGSNRGLRLRIHCPRVRTPPRQRIGRIRRGCDGQGLFLDLYNAIPYTPWDWSIMYAPDRPLAVSRQSGSPMGRVWVSLQHVCSDPFWIRSQERPHF